jgi:hypothetical protein
MLSREQQQTVWANAYNAALTGLLAARMHEMDRFSANNVSGITEQCKAFADQALKDATTREHQQNDFGKI